MIERFIKLWDEHKNKLEDRLLSMIDRNEDIQSYEELLSYLIKDVLNQSDNPYENFRPDEIVTVDFGSYQGTLIMIFHIDTYQPTVMDTFYTSVEYGSCSGCDALQRTQYHSYGREKVQDYMQLSLHLLQNIRCFKEEE